MIGMLKDLLSGKAKKARAEGRKRAVFHELHETRKMVYVVGDVHGCAKLYQKLEQKISDHAGHHGAHIILAGDMVDRGNETALLLDILTSPAPSGITRQCLMGNHEQMMLDFLEKPEIDAAWLQFGGLETLRSYGLSLDPEAMRKLSSRRLKLMLDAYIPDTHCKFLANDLVAGIQFGRFVIVHAAIDPNLDLEDQLLSTCLWGQPISTAPDTMTIVHGHKIQTSVSIERHRIGIDTGAYMTGILSAVALNTQDRPQILSTAS